MAAQYKADEAGKTEHGIAITDLATGNINASPLLVSSSPIVYNANQTKPAAAIVNVDGQNTVDQTAAAAAQLTATISPTHPQQHNQLHHPQNEMQKTSDNQNATQHQLPHPHQQLQQQQQAPPAPPPTHHQQPTYKTKSRKETLETKRERKAAKTLAIITGAFVVCWLPFFLTALLLPLCGEACSLNDTVSSLFLWLGYFNSTLNPVIYTIFSPEFRQAFKRILCGRTGYYRRGML